MSNSVLRQCTTPAEEGGAKDYISRLIKPPRQWIGPFLEQFLIYLI